jgi:hypothetical protein
MMVLLDPALDAVQDEVAEQNPKARYPRLTMMSPGLLNLRVSDRSGYWVASSAPLTERFGPRDRLSRDRLLVTAELATPLREYLEALFLDVVAGPLASFLPLDHLRDVLESDRRQDLAVGVLVNDDREAIVLIRGDFDRIVVPWSWFRPTPAGLAPEFGDVEVIDHGLTIRLGRYEAAVEAILYELDRDFRTRERQRRIEMDPSFGAALRRLRIQKGMPRSGFPGISEKEIARIERGEVSRPHAATLRVIADLLGVEPADIGTF